MNKKIRILIADDYPLNLAGLRQIIQKDSSLEIVAEAEEGQTALALAQQMKPDIAILDIEMPKLSGLAVARALQEKEPATKTIILTVSREEKNFDAALDAGAKGYVLKDCRTTDLIDCIKEVAKGNHYLSPAVSDYLVRRKRPTNEFVEKRSELTRTERRILKLIAEGHSSHEIAGILCVAYSTIETHRHNICTKLDIHTHNGLLKFALLHKSEL
jgi:two-component system, NarL family, response regulator DegU